MITATPIPNRQNLADNGSKPQGEDGFLLSLLQGKSVRVAALEAGIPERTAYRRHKDPAFRARLDAARFQVLERAMNELGLAALEAMEAVRGLLKSNDERVRLQAAQFVLRAVERREDRVRERQIRTMSPNEAAAFTSALVEAVRDEAEDDKLLTRVLVRFQELSNEAAVPIDVADVS